MANPESRKLAVDVTARVDKLEKEMKKASRAASDNFGKIEQRGKRMADKLERDLGGAASRIGGLMKDFGKGLLAGVAAGGIAGIVTQLGAVAKSVASIGDEAKRAGVSIEAFQEWRFVAEQNRIGIDQMVDGLKELNLRADEFVQTGSGPAAEAFQRLGYGAEDLQRKLKNPSELMLEIIDRLGQMDRAAQIRIADEIFGGSAGERFVELLEQGEQGIRSTIDRAHELGAVMDEDLIEKAAELDRRFNAVTTTVSTGLKTAIVESAAALQEFINTFQGWWDRFEQRRKAAEAGAAVGALAGAAGDGTTPSEVRTTPKTDRLPKAEWTPPTPPPGGFGSLSKAGGGGRVAAASSAAREAEAVRELIAELEEELRLVGATDLERAISNELRRAGAAATEEQKAKITALVTALYAEEQATRAASEASQELRDVGRDVLGGIIGDLRAGKDAADILASALDRVADRLANMALDALFGGGSGGMGLFSFIPKLFGFADGGIAAHGKPLKRFAGGGVSRSAAIFGEAGPEAAVPLPDGRSIPVTLSAPRIPAAAGAAKPQPATINVNVEGANGDSHVIKLVEQGVRAGIGRYDKQLNRTIGGKIANAQARQL